MLLAIHNQEMWSMNDALQTDMSSLENHPEIQDIDFVIQVNRDPFDFLVIFYTFGLLWLGAEVLLACVLVLRES